MARKKKASSGIRKYYPHGIAAGGVFAYPDRQPEGVRGYVGKYWDDTRRDIGVKTYGGQQRDAIHQDDGWHKMTKAKKRLKRGWEDSEQAFRRKNKKAFRSSVKKGSVSKAAMNIMRQHTVKFGVDPYHK